MKAKYLGICLVLVLAICGLSQAATKVLEWKFENNLDDTSGNGITGIAQGTAAYTAGVVGQAYLSDDSNCVYKTGISTAILPVLATDTWSVNVWVYPNGNPWYYDEFGVQRSWQMAWLLGGEVGAKRTLYCSDSGGIAFTNGEGRYIGTGIPWDVNQWQMITTTYDGTNVRMYKNSVLIGKKSFAGYFSDTAGEVRIPHYPWAENKFFKGKFDEFTIWRGVLTQEEIIALIPPGILPEGAFLDEMAYYTLDDPCDSTMTIPDHSGYSNTASLYQYTNPVGNWVAAGKKGGSLLFNGSQAVDLPTGATVSQYAQHSVAFWFKSGYQPFNSAFYSEGLDPKTNGSQLQIRGDAGTTGTIKAYSKQQYYADQYMLTYDASAYMDGYTWHHLAVTTDGDKAKMYLDGEVVTDANVDNLEGHLPMNRSSIGFNWDSLGYLGAWGKTYVDDLHIYKGVLTQEDVQALASSGNVNNDLDVDFKDLAIIANEWLDNTTSVAGATLLVDNMEGSLANWSVYASSTYTGTGTISSTTNAYAGSKAMQWDYSLPARSGGNYTSIVYNFGTDRNLTTYDTMKLYLYRHAGNTSEDMMFLKFIDASYTVKAEAWISGPNSVIQPVDQWSQWYINLNGQLHLGTGWVDKTVLNNIRYIMIGCGGAKETARTGTIDIDEVKIIKYPVCSPYLTGDIDSLECKDCKVDFRDFTVFAEDWMLGVD